MIDLVCENSDSNEEIVASYDTVDCDLPEENNPDDNDEIVTVTRNWDEDQNDDWDAFTDVLRRQLIEDNM